MSPRPTRRRYIAFRVEGPRPFSRDEILAAVQSLPGSLWLVTFRDGRGLVRSTNVGKDEAITNLNSLRSIAGLAAHVATLGTSGTIRAATRRYIR